MKLDAIVDLFSKSWRQFEKRFAVGIQIFAVPAILIVIGRLLIAENIFAAYILGGLINLVSIIFSVAASIALISAFGKGTDFGASYRTGFTLFWAAIWIAILNVLAVGGGLVMLIVPGIMLMVQLSMTNFAFVLDGKRGLAAIQQSREYVKGYWWAVFGRILLLVLLYVVASIIFLAPITIILGPIGGAIIYGIIIALLTPFAVAYEYEIFENLRRLKPDVGADAAKADTGFLKVAMAVGIVGGIALIIFFFTTIAYLVTHPDQMQQYQQRYQYTYPPSYAPQTNNLPPGNGVY